MRWFVLFVGWLTSGLAIAQPGGYDESVFNSIELEEVAYDGFSITSGYYTIANNIDNQQSSAFISHTPSADEYVYFAQHQPSYYFLVHRQHEVIRMIVLQQRVRNYRSQFFYTVIDPASGYRTEVSSQLTGELTQMRAKELMMSHVDSLANIAETRLVCSFNQQQYAIQPFAAVRQEVVTLAQRLLNKDRSQMEELEEYIRAETVGGTLDFRVALSKESRQHFSRGGVSYDKDMFSVLLWGGAVRMLGLSSVDNARVLWEDIKQRPLTISEAKALRKGFAEQDRSAHRSLPPP